MCGGSENGFLLFLNGRRAGLVAGPKAAQSPPKQRWAKDALLWGLHEEHSRNM